MVKRIIGIPGDTIEFVGGYVFINDELIIEDYLPEYTFTYSSEVFTVPENCYFMLGDNREHSTDSRFWTNPYVDIDEIAGKVFVNIHIKLL